MGIQTDKVRFNVGDKIFETSAITLASGRRSSMFGAMFDDEWNLQPRRVNEEYFIDRNPDCFSVLLDLLRTGELCVPPHEHGYQAHVDEHKSSKADKGGNIKHNSNRSLHKKDHIRAARFRELDANQLRLTSSVRGQASGGSNAIRASPDGGCAVAHSRIRILSSVLAKDPDDDSGIGLFSSSSGNLKHTFQLNQVKGFTAGASSFNSDGKIFAVCSGTGINGIGVWDQVTGEQTDFFHKTVETHKQYISLLDFRDKSMVWYNTTVNEHKPFGPRINDYVQDGVAMEESNSKCVVDPDENLGFMDIRSTDGNAIMNMYCKFQSMDKGFDSQRFRPGNADLVYEEIPERNFGRSLEKDPHSRSLKVLGKNQNQLLVTGGVTPKERYGYVHNGMCEEALRTVREIWRANLMPDSFTLSSILPIFAEYVDISRGNEIHGYTLRHGFDSDDFIASSLIDMYAKCTRVDDSLRIFHLLPQLDVISWDSIIAGCVQNGLFDEGLKLFRQMLTAKVKPSNLTFSSIMPACAHLMTLHLGKQLHGCITRNGFDKNVFIASALVDMYAKCGNIRIARSIFDKMDSPDMVSWTAMIMGHGGLVDEARVLFNCMIEDYGISPGLEHYAAVADLLGRAGKVHKNIELAEKVGEKVFQIDPENIGADILMSNIY
ncbi:hypothetical protein C5167_023218 [Papaver somniferum]|uniref:BTB domain-containing protein n=1 Tax=Papaver somniferum TaxID=3469 RepID=A0A4Y7JL26_PAPSO|nr:hypothetical protein C5167_023218 [Papaver somniferum]